MTFLFANSSSTLHWKIFEHCVNLDTLSSYLWARAVSTYINDSLITKAKAKKGGEASIGVVSGCTMIILFLLYEMTNIIQPILGKEKETPAILKWSLVKLHTRFNQIKDLNDIKKWNCNAVSVSCNAVCILSNAVSESLSLYMFLFNLHEKQNEDDEREQGAAEEQGKPDDADQTLELKEIRTKISFENEAGKEHVTIQGLLVNSMTAQINYHQCQDRSFVCPERLKLWNDETNKENEKKMMELWDIFIQAKKRSNELEAKLATYKEK
ncbi:hypothetical protein L3X38_025869 [Prunus dulcis]|uniref:Uncharacterized protein n=1 Tax=Prunus dulcis TaxID=3755 RepID=A0AAD4W2I7_PRUDU|nr:hypothetical protein L3X38_025869 [Prunus dulcis]